MKRAGISFLLAGVLLALVQFTGCADRPATFNRVTILLPRGAQIIGQGQSVSIQVSVLNDSAAGGVTFGAVAFGTIAPGPAPTTTATYTAPNPVTAETVVKIVITSVDFPNQSATLTITVEPPPTIATTSLPTAPLNGAYNATVTATGGVPPLSWSITAGALPAGLTLAKSTTDTVKITGKATAAGSSTFTITVTDSSAADPPSSQQLTIVVSSLAITTTSPLPSGTVGTAYDSPGLQFTATGGTGTDTWTVASGSTLPGGLSLSSTGVLSGTPTVAGTFTFGITATDSATPPAVVTSTFTLVINQQQQLTLLNGSYALEFSGYGSNGFTAFAGTFTANGSGGITGGEIDYNSQLGTPLNFANLAGTYTAGTDGRGTLTFTNTSLPTAPIFAFSVDASGNGRFIESDSSATRGSGRLELQTVTSCVVNNTGTSSYSGDFAFGGSGFASAFVTTGPLAFAARFTAVPPTVAATPGSLTQGEMDTNTPGLVTVGDATVSGSYNSGPDGTHCTLALTSASLNDPNYSVYPITSRDAFLIETDPVNGTTPYISAGEMIQQIGQPFVTTGVLSGTMVGGLSGQIISGTTFSPEVQVVQISATSGSSSFQILQADNQAGTLNNTNGLATTDPYTSDSLGRVQGSIEFNSSFEPVFYLINTNQAFCVGILQNAPTFGSFAPQSAGPFTTQTIKSTSLIDGTSAPAVSADRDLSGFLSFDGISAVGGTQDQSTTSGNTSATETGTYVLNPTGNTDGSGTMTLSTPTGFTGYFFIVSPTNVVMITTTPQDTNPVLIIIGH
jgi:Putative Ig domain